MTSFPSPIPPSLQAPANMILLLWDAAMQAAQKAAQAKQRRRPVQHRCGQTLSPGTNTPLWNELTAQALPLLRQRGSQAHLARLLGVPRQRIHQCLKARKACLDAERTLLLLCWITARQQGQDLFA